MIERYPKNWQNQHFLLYQHNKKFRVGNVTMGRSGDQKQTLYFVRPYGFSYKSSVPTFAKRGRNFANGIGFVVCLYNHEFLLILSFATDFPNNHDWSFNFFKRGRNFANGIVFIACL